MSDSICSFLSTMDNVIWLKKTMLCLKVAEISGETINFFKDINHLDQEERIQVEKIIKENSEKKERYLKIRNELILELVLRSYDIKEDGNNREIRNVVPKEVIKTMIRHMQRIEFYSEKNISHV